MFYIVKYQWYTIVDESDHVYGYYMTLTEAKRKVRRLLTLTYGL